MNKKDKLSLLITALSATSAVVLFKLIKNERYFFIPVYLVFGFLLVFLIVYLLFYNKKNIIKYLITILISCFIFSFVCIYSFSLSAIFIPHFDEEAYNSLKRYSSAEELSFTFENKNIFGWYYKNEGENNPVILMYYGNGENASTVLNGILTGNKSEFFRGFDIAVFDYPGYGLSEGRTNEKSFKKFSLAVYDEISRFNNKIIIQGYSIGTGAACYAAAERNPAGLILYAPYADGPDLYNNFLDIFHNPLTNLMISFNLENIKYAEKISCPVLVCASRKDKMVSFHSSEKLAESFTDCRFENAGDISHNEFRSDPYILNLTVDFTEEILENEK